MATKNVKYPGSLGKRLTIRELSAAASAVLLKPRVAGLPAMIAVLEEEQQDRVAKLFVDLLHYFEIPLDTDDKWFSLALRLAFKHVPAFQDAKLRGVGRPKKLEAFRSLADLANQYAQTKTKGKPGRKRKYTDGQYRGLLKSVRETCVEKGFKGRGAVTKALTELLSNHALKHNQSVTKTLRRNLNFLRRWHSEAKKRFPELVV